MTDEKAAGWVWERLGAPASEQLRAARIATHTAVQLLSSAAGVLARPEEDDGHRSFRVQGGLMWGCALERASGARVRLAPATLELAVVAEDGTLDSSLLLTGLTLQDATRWLEARLNALSGAPVRLEWPEYDLPPSSIADGEPFPATGPAFEELARWFSNGALLLDELAARVPDAGPVRAWPHHFDIALLIHLDEQYGEGQTIGVGLSPGEGGYDQPYWYVSPWPYPDSDALPALGGVGHWHTEGWTGAVLVGADLVAASEPAAQRKQVESFVEDAIKASRVALGR